MEELIKSMEFMANSKQKFSDQQQQLKDAEEKNLELKNCIEQLRKEMEQVQREKSQLESKLEDSERDKKEYQKTLDNLQIQLEGEVTKCSQLRTDLEEAQLTIYGKKQKLVEAEGIISEKEKAAKETAEKMMKQFNDILANQMNEKQLEIERLEQCLQDEKQDNTDVVDKFQWLRESVFSLSSEFAEFIEEIKISEKSGGDGRNGNDSSAQEKLTMLSTLVKRKFIAWAENQKKMKDELAKTQQVVISLSQLFGQCLRQKLQANKNVINLTSIPVGEQNATVKAVNSYRDIARQSILPEVPVNNPTNVSKLPSAFVLDSLNYIEWPQLSSSISSGGKRSTKATSSRRQRLFPTKRRSRKSHDADVSTIKGRCIHCGKPFSSWDKLYQHKRTVHTSQKSKKTLQRLGPFKATKPASPQNPVPALKICLKKCQSQQSSSSWKILSALESQFPISPPSSIITGDENVAEDQQQNQPISLPEIAVEMDSSPTTTPEVIIPRATTSGETETTTSAEPNIPGTSALMLPTSPMDISIPRQPFTPETSNGNTSKENVAIDYVEGEHQHYQIVSPSPPQLSPVGSIPPPSSSPPTLVRIKMEDPPAQGENPSITATDNSLKPKHAQDWSKQKLGLFCKCGHQAQNKSALRQHIKYYSTAKQFCCWLCKNFFKFNYLLENHLKNVHGLKNYKLKGCRHCDRLFRTLIELKEHQINEHPRIKINRKRKVEEIDLTNKEAVLPSSKNVGSLPSTRKRTNRHHFPNRLSTTEPEKTLTNPTPPLARTTSLPHPPMNKFLPMIATQATESEKNQFLKNLDLRPGPNRANQTISTPYKSIQQDIDISPENFNDEEDMIVDAHLAFEEYQSVVRHGIDAVNASIGHFCVCGQEYSKRRSLMSHVRYYSAKRKFICKTCGHGYLVTWLLRSHMRRAHGISYKASNGCKNCGKTFPTNMELYHHFRMVHNRGAQWTTREMKYVPPSTPNPTSIQAPNYATQGLSQEVPVPIKMEKL